MKRLIALLLTAAAANLTGCFVGDENNWASKEEIVAAAKHCGIDDCNPYKAGAAWAAYVDNRVPNAKRKEDCIYARLKRQGLIATR